MEEYILKGGQRLRLGYTTGTCAAAAAQAASEMLFGGGLVEKALIHTPKGIDVEVDVLNIEKGAGWASCAVRKDGGDDPDATHGMLIYARAEIGPEGVELSGGEGVGRVAKPGLSVDVGLPAINPAPRKMIEGEARRILEKYREKGVKITVFAPGGAEIAKRTFNPRLGIVGGISILGTSGIVEPMSEDALVATVRLEASTKLAQGRRFLIASPGNYGTEYARLGLGIGGSDAIKFSNFAGEIIDFALSQKADGLLLIGHFGKFVKLAGGIMNTHSRFADCRMQIIAAEAALCGAGRTAIKKVMSSVTVDEALDWLGKNDLKEMVVRGLMEKIAFHIQGRSYGQMPTEAITFTQKHGFLGQTGGAQALLEKCRGEIAKEKEGGAL